MEEFVNNIQGIYGLRFILQLSLYKRAEGVRDLVDESKY